MNVESFISFLSRSNWFFLAGLILLLAAAFALTFSEQPGQNPPSGSNRAQPR
jgi:uncharacterized protein involved in exopolysaccharide biosynthesis